MPVAPGEIVGREAELERLETFLGGGLPAAVVLDGEAGIGKTTLWRAGVDLARGLGYRVLTAAPAESEAQLSFAALRDLFEELFDELQESLPEPQRVALSVALLRDDRGPVADDALRAAAARLVDVAAAEGPLLIAVDDVHWLDRPSTAALEFALRRLNDRPVAILLGRRSDEPAAAPLGLGRALPERSLTLIRLGGLALGALGRVFRTRLGASLPRRTLVRIHEASAGNPFYALELARALGDEVSALPPGAALPLTPELRELLDRRLAEAPPNVQELLLLCSALAVPTLETVAQRGAPSASVEAAIDRELLTVSGERLRFAHPLIASAVYDRASADERRALHRRLAQLAADPEERAVHLSRAAVSPDEATAAAIEEGADRAFRRAAVDTAGWLALEARRLTPSERDDELLRRGLKVCDYLRPVGATPEVQRAIAELVATAPPGPLRARALFEAASKTENVDDKLELSERALAEAGDDWAVRARLNAQRSRAFEGAGKLDDAARMAEAELEAAERTGDPEAIVRAIARAGRFRFLTGGGIDHALMKRGRELEASVEPFLAYHSASSSLADQLMWSDELDEARRIFETLVERTLRAGAENSLVALRLQLAEVENRAARWARAAAYAREGVELAREVEHDSIQAPLLFQQAVAEAHLGRLDDARELLGGADSISRTSGEAVYAVSYESLHGFIALSAGDADTACAHLAPLRARAEEMGVDDPGVFPLVPNVIDALIAAGRLDEAEDELTHLAERARPLERSRALAFAARGRALVEAARGDTETALRTLDDAFAQHRHFGDPFEHARTLLALGVVRRRGQQRREARRALEQAREQFESLGAPLWADRARAEAGRIGGRAPSGEDLTPTERRVAELVAEGRSNREVAAALFVTAKTVEVYLSRIYAKLGLRSRTELARRFFEESQTGKL